MESAAWLKISDYLPMLDLGVLMVCRLTLRRMAEAGFSLTELMIVVAIIGILASLAIPRFQMFQAKARQSEARSNLTHIYTLQISYQGDNDTFSNFEFLTHGRVSGYWWSESPTAYVWNGYNLCNKTNDIGFRITDCKKVRYLYRNIGTQSTFLVYAAELDKA